MARRPGHIRVVQLVGRLSQAGGVQVVIRRLARGVAGTDIDLHVVTLRPLDPRDDLGEVPVEVHPLGFRGDARLRVRDRLGLMVRAARVVHGMKPDVVQLHSGVTWLGWLARVVAPGAGWIVEVHDAPGSGRHGAWTDRFEGVFSRVSRATIVCHSNSVAGEVRDRWRIRADRLVRFGLSVDTGTFAPRTGGGPGFRERHGIPGGAFVIVGVGRMVPSKRFGLALEALVRVPDAWLVLVGGGSEQDVVAGDARALGVADRLVQVGALYGTDLVEALAAADVLSSTSAYEGFGLTLVEGMACGLPVVAMAVGGTSDIVVDGVTGFLVGPDDTQAYVERMVLLAGSPDLVARMGAAGRQRAVEEFDDACFSAAFAEVYRTLAASGRPAVGG